MEPLVAQNGFSAVSAKNDAEALDLYTRNSSEFCMIIADVKLYGDRERDLARLNFSSRMLPFLLFTQVADAGLAVKLLEFGVRDYLVKPVSRERFMAAVNHALERAPHPGPTPPAAAAEPLGMDFLVIRSKSGELAGALEWVRKRTDNALDHGEAERFLCFVNELLLNAHEHGNLRISEEEKARLLERDAFANEIHNREGFIDARIEIALLVNGGKVTINITDQGGGFDFRKYLSLTPRDLMDKLFSPCGRGIFLTTQYFDSVEYSKGGRSVTLVKDFVAPGRPLPLPARGG
jgi:DNA-binding response OmpR family regulator